MTFGLFIYFGCCLCLLCLFICIIAAACCVVCFGFGVDFAFGVILRGLF